MGKDARKKAKKRRKKAAKKAFAAAAYADMPDFEPIPVHVVAPAGLKVKSKCCKKYIKKGKMCKNCPNRPEFQVFV